MARSYKGHAKGVLVSKQKEDGIKGLVSGTPGSSDYYKAEYRYAQDGKDKVYSCYMLGEPPAEVHIKTGLVPSLVGDVAVRATKAKNGFLSYSEPDSITPRMVLVAALPFVFAMLVFGIMSLII